MQRALNMQVKNAKRQHKLNRLQRLVARFEPASQGGPYIGTGFDAIDTYLRNEASGGLPCGGVHEVVAARSGDMAAALGFAHRLAAQFLHRTALQHVLLYGQTHAACREAGQHDLSDAHLAYLDGVALPDLLWAGEEALSCAAIGCTLLASWDAAPDFTASRRLTLAARAAERPIIIALGAQAAGAASAATTRWQIESLPQQGWHIHLAKLRLSHNAMPPAQGWRVYPQAKKLPMQPVINGQMSGEMSAPLMARSGF
jgi:protein ImuA